MRATHSAHLLFTDLSIQTTSKLTQCKIPEHINVNKDLHESLTECGSAEQFGTAFIL
jgi:hypothetical protein